MRIEPKMNQAGDVGKIKTPEFLVIRDIEENGIF
jgi:hypothetical protein